MGIKPARRTTPLISMLVLTPQGKTQPQRHEVESQHSGDDTVGVSASAAAAGWVVPPWCALAWVCSSWASMSRPAWWWRWWAWFIAAMAKGA